CSADVGSNTNYIF
nr:immunoglobulin light chain junction region [Macaca mulatta]MPN81407.1 immunoglobulin light chain junction region [Macaca mulatta]